MHPDEQGRVAGLAAAFPEPERPAPIIHYGTATIGPAGEILVILREAGRAVCRHVDLDCARQLHLSLGKLLELCDDIPPRSNVVSFPAGNPGPGGQAA